MVRPLALLLVLAVPLPASAQSGAFNMGVLTNTLSQGAITQSEERRARRQASPRRSRDRLAQLCLMRHSVGRQPGDEADYRWVERTCRANGF